MHRISNQDPYRNWKGLYAKKYGNRDSCTYGQPCIIPDMLNSNYEHHNSSARGVQHMEPVFNRKAIRSDGISARTGLP